MGKLYVRVEPEGKTTLVSSLYDVSANRHNGCFWSTVTKSQTAARLLIWVKPKIGVTL